MAEFKGKGKALARLAALPPKVRQAVSKAMQEGAREITNMQKRLVPVDSGDLRRSIRAVKGSYTPENANVRGFGGARKGDPDLTIHLVAGNAKAFYASFVEFGTPPHLQGGKFKGTRHPGTKPRPYFYPAYRDLRRRYKLRVNRAIKQAIKDSA